MDYQHDMDCMQLAGRIILENGGETNRAEDTVTRMGQALGLSEVEVFGVPSGLFISFIDNGGQRQTSVKRIRKQGTNLRRVDEVNSISRALAQGELDAAAAYRRLETAACLGGQTRWWALPLAAGVSSAGFTVMFQGGLVDSCVGFACAALCQLLVQLLFRFWQSGVVSTLLGSALCTFLPLVFARLTGLGVPDAMIAGALMPLLPGLQMTNAVSDTLRGDMVSGVAHGASALLTAALVAGGALAANRLFLLLVGGLM